MPYPTPFYEKIAPLVETNEWRSWSGYKAPVYYDHAHEREYFAFRSSAGLLDVSPLFKYDITGPDTERWANRVFTRDFTRCRVGQVFYTPWCDETGDMIHDGNVVRLAADHLRVTAADPCLAWFNDLAYGLDVTIEDVSEAIAGLALQGPKARQILKQLVRGADLDRLRYFRQTRGSFGGGDVIITRTGYTGDLGYELWVEAGAAGALWDGLFTCGRPYGLLPAGLGALDMVRVEAGLVLIEVDYISARHAVIDGQKSNPLETGMAWAVDFDKGYFVGREALLAHRENPEWQLVGLEVDWFELERLWGAVNLRPKIVGRGTSREAVPVYRADGRGVQIGQATSHLFSPLLKKYIALATLKTPDAAAGARVHLEMTVEYSRYPAEATIVPLPFFNPERKRAVL